MQVSIVRLIVLSIVMGFALGDIVGPIPHQSTCGPLGSNTCSDSPLCQCAAVTTGEHVCTQQMSCTYAEACGTNDSCAKNGTVCVVDNRCPGQRLCYSVNLFSPELCPPRTTSNAEGSMK